jgi:carbamoyl-phosphate synthase large subunit
LAAGGKILTNVLLTSAGTDSFPAMKDAFDSAPEDFRVIGCDIDKKAFGLLLADKGHIVPKREAPGFIPKLLDICKEEGVSFIFPLCPQDQPVLAAHKREFGEAGVSIIASAIEVVNKAGDKIQLHDFCKQEGIGVGRYFVCRSLDEVKETAANLGYPKKKVVLKRRISAGGQGVRMLESMDNKELFWKQSSMLDSLENFLYYFKDADFPKDPGDILIEEYLPGPEYSIDTISDDRGRVIQAVVRERFRSVGGMALHAEVVDSEDVRQEAIKLADALGLCYINNIQFKRNEAGKPCIMEINPRVPGTICLTIDSGVNMPYMAVRIARGETVAPMPSKKLGVVRYYTGINYNPER